MISYTICPIITEVFDVDIVIIYENDLDHMTRLFESFLCNSAAVAAAFAAATATTTTSAAAFSAAAAATAAAATAAAATATAAAATVTAAAAAAAAAAAKTQHCCLMPQQLQREANAKLARLLQDSGSRRGIGRIETC